MSRRKPPHRVTVAKRTLYGRRMWWATCNIRHFGFTWFQGCNDKQEAERLAAEHLAKQTD